MINSETTVNISELEICLGIRKTKICVLEQSGVIVRRSRGKYALVQSINNYHEYLKNQHNVKTSEGNVIDYQAERARKTREEADALERKRRTEEGEMLNREDYSVLISEVISVQSRELAGLPVTLRRLIPGISAKAIEQVTKACARSHNAVLDLRLDE